MHPRLAPNEEAFHLVLYAIAPEALGRKAVEAFTTKITALWPIAEGEFIQAHPRAANPVCALPAWRLEAHFIRSVDHGRRLSGNGWREQTTAIIKVLKRRYPEVIWLLMGAASQPGEPGHEGKRYAEIFVNKDFRRLHPRKKHMWVCVDTISTRAPPHPTDFCLTVDEMEDCLAQELRQLSRIHLPEIAAYLEGLKVQWRAESLEKALEPAGGEKNKPRL